MKNFDMINDYKAKGVLNIYQDKEHCFVCLLCARVK